MIQDRANHLVDDITSPTPWMRPLLLFAAAYNIVWGLVAVVAPVAMLGWLGIESPSHPEFWQCIGMIVGVYGIGYAIAARDAYRHWPIVLVGLLGKVFGPLGFAVSIWNGRLPVSMSWTILTNDLIWWVPFGVILWRAAQAHQSSVEQIVVPPPTNAPDPLRRILSQYGTSLHELSRKGPVLVVLLRHSGCIFCRETMADLTAQREQITSLGTQIALVHMGQREPDELLKRYGLSDLPCYRDPMCQLYDHFKLPLGTVRQLLGLRVWIRGLQAMLSGHGLGALNGNGFRMPGVFLIRNGRVVREHRHDTASDRPDYVALAAPEPSAAMA